MTRSDLIQRISQDEGISSALAADIVGFLFDNIADRLTNGGRVELRGFGTFSTRSRRARDGRNPRTGETVTVIAKRVPHFKPGKAMQKRVDMLGDAARRTSQQAHG